jgi:ABC-type phosphate/phosphonate transport system substrate-binding protein
MMQSKQPLLLFILFASLFWAMVACGSVQTLEVTRVVVTESDPEIIREVVTDVVTETLSNEIVLTYVITEVETVVTTPFPAGSATRPLQLVFPLSHAEGIVTQRGTLLAEALAAETGLNVETIIVDDMVGAIALLCASPDQVIAFLPAFFTQNAMETCNAQPALVGEKFGVAWHAGMFLVRAGEGLNTDEGIESLSDLNSRIWGIASEDDLVDTIIAGQVLENAGISISNTILYNGESNALLALLNREVDFVSLTYIPPLMPFNDVWTYGEDGSEIWRRLGVAPRRTGLGMIEVFGGPDEGGYRIRDARANIFDTNRNIFDDTRIVGLTPPIPNGGVVMGSAIPLGIANQINDALVAYSHSDQCLQSICSPDFYHWSGVTQATPSIYADLDEWTFDTNFFKPEF